MPKWTSEPPTDREPYAYRILRTPADKPLTGIITCTDIVGLNTHYVHNRTVPCEGIGACPWCDDGHSYRWHAYVSALIQPGLEHALFESTAAASETLRNYLAMYDTVRGCYFRGHRPSKRANGRVVIECRPTDPAKTRLPDPPDVKRILCHIWSVQYTKAADDLRTRYPAKDLHVTPSNGDGRNRPATHAK